MRGKLKTLGYVIALPFLCLLFMLCWAIADEQTRLEIDYRVNQALKQHRLLSKTGLQDVEEEDKKCLTVLYVTRK